jgi:hypothetical protein
MRTHTQLKKFFARVLITLTTFSSMTLAAAAIRDALTLAVLSALLLLAPSTVQAQTETVL